jgi:hypothetical protein
VNRRFPNALPRAIETDQTREFRQIDLKIDERFEVFDFESTDPKIRHPSSFFGLETRLSIPPRSGKMPILTTLSIAPRSSSHFQLAEPLNGVDPTSARLS